MLEVRKGQLQLCFFDGMNKKNISLYIWIEEFWKVLLWSKLWHINSHTCRVCVYLECNSSFEPSMADTFHNLQKVKGIPINIAQKWLNILYFMNVMTHIYI